jgi:hypothetical protein
MQVSNTSAIIALEKLEVASFTNKNESYIYRNVLYLLF